MSEVRAAVASKVCLAMILAGGFIVLAAAFPVHAATGPLVDRNSAEALAVMLMIDLTAMCVVLWAVLRSHAPRPKPVRAKRTSR